MEANGLIQFQLTAEVEERVRTVETLITERRILHSQLREREDSIEQLHQELSDAQQSKVLFIGRLYSCSVYSLRMKHGAILFT